MLIEWGGKKAKKLIRKMRLSQNKEMVTESNELKPIESTLTWIHKYRCSGHVMWWCWVDRQALIIGMKVQNNQLLWLAQISVLPMARQLLYTKKIIKKNTDLNQFFLENSIIPHEQWLAIINFNETYLRMWPINRHDTENRPRKMYLTRRLVSNPLDYHPMHRVIAVNAPRSSNFCW